MKGWGRVEEEDDDMSSFIFQSIAFSQYSKEEQEEDTETEHNFLRIVNFVGTQQIHADSYNTI